MCEQTEISYLDGDIVWVKLGSCWWPGEVVGSERLPPDLLPSFRKPPIAVVKFFQESSYEYVKNTNLIYKYNCSRKNEFINKGLYMYRTKHGHMEKFPEDVIRAETAVGGDIEILTRDEFQEQKKESYAGIFGDTPKKTPGAFKRGRGRGGRTPSESPRISSPARKFCREKTDYKVHILVQPSKETPSTRQSTESAPSPSTSRAGSEPTETETSESPIKPQKVAEDKPTTSTTPSGSNSGIYACHSCNFSTSRLNVLILHNKTHSSTFIPYTPSPVRKKPAVKSATKQSPKSPKIAKTPKPKKEKAEKVKKAPKKRQIEEKIVETPIKKPKTDQEIKSSLLADWDDDVDDESTYEESSAAMSGSPEIATGSESPPVPTPAELPSAHVPAESSSPEKKSDDTTDKPESSSDSKYEFCEDEDWHVEADAGRKIPRVKNPSKRKEETKSLSVDDEDVAKEVAELLNRTSVPELPSIPEPLKAEENFPEPPVVKSPDKCSDQQTSNQDKKPEATPTKPIFKTKTFFRSRHSRSQDAIGKYVAEQLNAAERMDISECDLNGSEATSSPEARESPPIEHVKVARLTPKIQLKKMKAEAAQMREKEKDLLMHTDKIIDSLKNTKNHDNEVLEIPTLDQPKLLQDVLYPTQEIKPINKEVKEKASRKEDKTTDDGDINLKPFEVIEASNTETNKENSDQLLSSAAHSNVQSPRSPNLHVAHNQDNGDGCNKTPNVPDAPVQSNTDISDDNNSQDSYSHLPEIVTDDNKITTKISPQKPRILNMELNSPVKDPFYGSPKRALLSPQSPLEKTPSPKKMKESVSLPDKLINPGPVKQYNQYMSESTASAVDALLSVSRETDRVPKIISNDPPEDLFEDDIRDNITVNETVEVNTDDVHTGNGLCETSEPMQVDEPQEEIEISNEVVNETTVKEYAPPVEQDVVIDNSVLFNPVEDKIEVEIAQDNIPSESDLQIAETLLNLPATAIQSKVNEISDTVEVTTTTEEVHDNITNVFESPANNKDSPDVNVSSESLTLKNNDNNFSSESLTLKNNDNNLNIRYESELEKNENLNAAQSLVQMSESIDHTVNIIETHDTKNESLKTELLKKNNGIDNSVEQNIALLSSENNREGVGDNSPKFETTSSKLLKILEEPSPVKTLPPKTVPLKQVIVQPKEKILNFDVAKSQLKSKTPTKQKIIIRRAPSNKTTINNLSEIISPDKIILSRNNSTQDGSSVQTFTIQTTPDIQTSNDPKQIIIQPKFRKITKPKIQKLKQQTSLITPVAEPKTLNQSTASDESMFDINSMPVVLSDDILTPESIEKMPIVMSDGNIITNTTHAAPNPPKLIKSKPTIIENEKISISTVPDKISISSLPEKIAISAIPNKPEVKTLLMTTTKSPQGDIQKVTTPNILSKSSKLRGAKPMLVIDKATGKQKIIMTKAEPQVKEIVKPTTSIIQSLSQSPAKTEKFIILPSASSPRPGRQKIVIDPQTGKAHVLVAKGQEPPLPVPENKPVSAKIIPSSSDSSAPGNTVMIITNAQGNQSRIVLTPEHEKILFPNKHQPNVSQLKTVAHRISTNTGVVQKTIVTSASHAPVKTQTKIVPKQQKSAIITSKGQLIVGGRIATTAQNIAPMPEFRPAPKRIIASEPKKLVQAIQKNSPEPLIFLQQKSGAVMQLTTAQFEHLQRTGQIIQKSPAPLPENKIIVQKQITIPKEASLPAVQPKQRVRKIVSEQKIPAKKLKQEVPIAPAPIASISIPPVPPLTSLSTSTSTPVVTISSIIPSISNVVSVSTTPNYPQELENFEELLPSTAIVKKPEPPPPAVEPPPAPEPPPAAPEPPPDPQDPDATQIDGQLLAVPGDHFGGPVGTFYLCFQDNGNLTPIDHIPLILENNQLVPMSVEMPAEPMPMFCPQPERRDILEAALANSDVFHEPPRDDAPDFRDLNANVSVHCRVSETSTTLNQPIMTPVEVPTKGESEPVPSTLEDVIGVTPHVPTSLELPITVTDPRIAPKTTDPLSNSNYGTSLLPSPNTEMFVVSEEPGPISMPLLTDEEGVGKSMPILTDEAERAVSSVESRESEPEEGWGRRLLTPGSDTSDASAEIPLQPNIQLSVNDISHA